LRRALYQHEITGQGLSLELDCEEHSVSKAMMAKRPWKISEMYKILDLINEPHSRMHEFFPPNGKSAG
jgi:hypothetical protein